MIHKLRKTRNTFIRLPCIHNAIKTEFQYLVSRIIGILDYTDIRIYPIRAPSLSLSLSHNSIPYLDGSRAFPKIIVSAFYCCRRKIIRNRSALEIVLFACKQPCRPCTFVNCSPYRIVSSRNHPIFELTIRQVDIIE
ncbi:MAG: hypothetical protein BECKG1743D_GA0114223_107093 [Candidatus Kentron sp. G]|nr:MAG: hypothetical protein BECKG1743E_GA0114224_100876 [Candidatus Kentron sp. G]VFN04255.1 MAG: hypothetical protein BECKG1743F_GA0114225_109083 [Candidatus Kentron sp. G]VFN05367.1 MAG: hypothetical protein BECKG1743D_GA0114223_107093 [Candidatus Kentron sp. G]